jgi:hypothetical protein
VLVRLCVGDECLRISLLSRRDKRGGGVSLWRLGGADESTTFGSEAGGADADVELRRRDQRVFCVESDTGREPVGR